MCDAVHLSQKEQSGGTLAGELVTQPLSVVNGGTMQLQSLVGTRTWVGEGVGGSGEREGGREWDSGREEGRGWVGVGGSGREWDGRGEGVGR